MKDKNGEYLKQKRIEEELVAARLQEFEDRHKRIEENKKLKTQ
jgi:hypothetical protein